VDVRNRGVGTRASSSESDSPDGSLVMSIDGATMLA
jgi:hypothetical protein